MIFRQLFEPVSCTYSYLLACADTATTHEVETAKLFRLVVAGLPPMFSDMGVVSLKGRSFSPMAQFAVDFLKQWGEK